MSDRVSYQATGIATQIAKQHGIAFVVAQAGNRMYIEWLVCHGGVVAEDLGAFLHWAWHMGVTYKVLHTGGRRISGLAPAYQYLELQPQGENC